MCCLKDCIYHTQDGRGGYDCDYMLTRIDYGYRTDCRRGCPPGKGCIRYVKGGKKLSRNAHAVQTFRNMAEFHSIAKQLYAIGKTDKEIARRMRCQESSVMRWRIAHKLPENPEKPRFSFDTDLARKMILEGYSEKEISEALNVKIFTLRRFKKVTNTFGECKGKRKCKDNRAELYAQGMTDREISDALGIDPKVISAWRSRRNLPPNKKKKEGTK